ncbi:class I SAM-dependent methyltransferase [Dankookia sp. P2]|uniref:class I SAM-dependent methyltransferase n=1 Tax=Dankookia sp. P2 TaxID=3423955 RepID=UPI003D669165
MMDAMIMPADADIGNDGERMIVANIWPYWAHLSIYHFAMPFAVGRRVLDAGAGEGYGAAYLARSGAKAVRALEFSAGAVRHARRRYADLPVRYEEADLNRPLPAPDRSFDLVFSSNVFEHIARVDALAAEVARVLAGDGVAVIAVPPITWATAMEADMRNHFHVHHIPPSAWEAKLRRFFSEVRVHGHRGRGLYAAKDREREEMALPPDRVTIRETDFRFPETTTEAMERNGDAITAVFVCRGPRPVALPETIIERTPAEWCEGAVAARLIAAGRAEAQAALEEARRAEAHAGSEGVRRAEAEAHAALEAARRAEAHAALEEARRAAAEALSAALSRAEAAEARLESVTARLSAIEATTSWRMTAPVRHLVTRLRARAG